ncbi:MAG: ribosome silencing factor [Porticoccaceae bacterium]|jgi:ribosome-associated protein|nr:ribosome silencing factor [Porticoccaceae bacterium]
MTEQLDAVVLAALEDVKGQDIARLDVRGLTDVTDTLVVASGSSTRQVKALAEHVIEACRAAGFPTLGVEGLDTAEWVLVDLGDLVLHVMLPATRSFYELEKLWSLRPEDLRRGED